MKAACGISVVLGLLLHDCARASEPIPPHQPLELVGLHAYAQKSLPAGKMIHFRVSSTVPYQLSVCRLGVEVDDPSHDDVLKTFPASSPLVQPIHPGSYAHVEKTLPADEPLDGLTLECWVRPWRPDGWQSLITVHDYPVACGYGLFIGPEGRLQFYLGDGGQHCAEWTHAGPKLQQRRWQHVVGTWDGQTKSLWVDGQCVGRWECAVPLRSGNAPIRLAACGSNGEAVNFLDGDLAMPAIYGRALVAEEISARFKQRGLEPAEGEGLLACWPLDEERGARISDASGNGRHGRIINQATWMIGGPGFDGSQVPRYGDYDPKGDPKRGHGLRFASDDLYDCRWDVTHEYVLPKTARPGIYVGRFHFEIDGVPRQYNVTFVLRRPDDRSKAPVLVIASTNSWLAYTATPFAVTPPGLHYHWGTGGITNSAGNPPAYCMYRNHRTGQPAYKVGVNRPWPNAGPYVLYAQGGSGYSHLMRAERFALIWLERCGYAYDMVSDLDVHRNPDLLSGYEVVIINGHSEYWSREAYEGLDRYLCGGGDALVLSGNAVLWRVSFNREGTVMECRKFDPRLGGRQGATIGELWHSQDGLRGSLMREAGYPGWKLIGLEPVGWWGIGPNDFGVYHVERPGHFLFNQPEPVGLAEGDTFGGVPSGGVPRAVGHECDVRLSLLRSMTAHVPDGATLPDEPAGMVTLANGILPRTNGMDYFTQPAQLQDGIVANLIYWQRPRGGRVFNTGSLGSGWGLSADPKFQTLIRNVLHHFGVKPTRGGGQ